MAKESVANVGRPLLYNKVEDLEKDIEAYFESCFEEKWFDEIVRHPVTGHKQKDPETGRYIERPVKRRVQVEPITITGLAVHLNTSRRTLMNYQERPEFFHAIKKAKDFCEKYVANGMMKGDINAVVGIFNLKNNFAWEDKVVQDQNVNSKVTKIVINRANKPKTEDE